MTPDEWRCSRKARYKTERAARLKVKAMKRAVIDPFRLEVYACERCGGWHVGNRPIKLRR